MKLASPSGGIQQAGVPETVAKNVTPWFYLRLDTGANPKGAISPLKTTKVTLSTMKLYNSENNISKPILNKFFVKLEMSN